MTEPKFILTMQRPKLDADVFIYERTPDIETSSVSIEVYGTIIGHDYKSTLLIERANICAVQFQPVTQGVALNSIHAQMGMEGVKFFCKQWEIDFEDWKKENNV